MDGSQPEARRLRRNVEWALRRALDPGTVLPMLHRLSRLVPDGSDDGIYAQRRLAELLADHHPWRAALSAKRVLAARPDDDGAWAILGLCHALLGHYRCAVASYRHAMELSPRNAAYAHNLGHLVDVALGEPALAICWLELAYELTGGRADVAVSLAHALGRAGNLEKATAISDRALESNEPSCEREHAAIARWLAEGAHAEPRILPRQPPARIARAPWKRVPTSPAVVDDENLGAILSKGLARLPLDRTQRDRARGLARELFAVGGIPSGNATRASVAAAIAYAIVFADQVPLTQAEVGACFRVSVPALRGQWKALRARIEPKWTESSQST